MQRTLESEVMDTAEEAEAYDAMDHSEPNDAFVRRLLQLGAEGRMLDIGTGPGQIPLLVCERLTAARVVAIDLSEEMLARAEGRRRSSEHGDRVELRMADAKRLDLGGGEFDVVFSNTILHHIPDPRPFLAEAWRVLRPGGALLIRDLFRPPTPARAEELVVEHAGGESAYQQELFRASLHAALTPEELREAAEEVGLTGAEVVVDTDRHMSLQRPASAAR